MALTPDRPGAPLEIVEGVLSPLEREDLLRAIGDALPKAFFYRVVHRADGALAFSYLSSGVEEVTGLTSSDMFERASAFSDLIVEEDRPRFWEAMGRALEVTFSMDVTVRLRRPDGALRWCHIRSGTRRTPAGTSVCQGVALDVTDQRRVEDALAESQTRNQAILSALPDLMFVMDRDGTYLDYHARDVSRLLVSPEQFMGKRMADVLPPDLVQKFERRFEEVIANGGTAVQEYSLTLGGELRHFEGRVVSCGPDRFLAIIRDTTDSKRAQDEAHHNRLELARVSRMTALGEIAASLAHELNQPLAAILNNAQAAQRLLAVNRATLDDTNEILGDIAHDCQRAGQVIWRLRALLNREETARQVLSVNQIVSDVEPLVRSELLTRRVSLATLLADDLPEIVADRIQLQQVLLNLVLNAMDAMHEAAPEDRLVRIRTMRLTDDVQVEVQDRGVGIRPEHQDRLFEPFFSTRPAGLGMGLRICASIVDAHGGRIWARNNPDGGATFSFTLPVKRAES